MASRLSIAAYAHSEDDEHLGNNNNTPPPGENADPTPRAQSSSRRKPRRRPVDIERQCGVPMGGEGRLCGAALMCRRHSMSAKRSVAGRSAPFDLLLLAATTAEERREE
ncbi:Putative SCA7 domain, SAGA-associated factor 73 [Colletotrichum destructivum]|uniref:SCA7 domain, SAGA-associated factor 73 n=1 Tax=Colletotrichum destructivum TaxID=34406 RepID=A0AAX4IVX5_9PEZI|nr:Putative SCA7 domain, SAGA-associated factor 73 [Colletotrichum destructivum]